MSGKVIYLKKMPRVSGYKWQATLPNGATVRFGAAGYEDYTTHGNALRMERYLVRHGGSRSGSLKPKDVHSNMLRKARSSREKWGKDGVGTAGFWSRWLLWSMPSIQAAKKHIEKSVLKGYKIVIRR